MGFLTTVERVALRSYIEGLTVSIDDAGAVLRAQVDLFHMCGDVMNPTLARSLLCWDEMVARARPLDTHNQMR